MKLIWCLVASIAIYLTGIYAAPAAYDSGANGFDFQAENVTSPSDGIDIPLDAESEIRRRKRLSGDMVCMNSDMVCVCVCDFALRGM